MTHDPYPTPQTFHEVKPARPGSVTTVAIIAIILGSLGILCGLPGAILNGTGTTFQFANVPSVKPSASLRYAGLIVSILTLIMSVLLLIGGIASLQLKRWGRRFLINYAIAELIVALVILVISFTIVNPETKKMMSEQMAAMAAGPQRPAVNMQPFVDVSLVFGAVIRWLVASALPVVILILYRRPNIIDAFEQRVPLASIAPASDPTIQGIRS